MLSSSKIRIQNLEKILLEKFLPADQLIRMKLRDLESTSYIKSLTEIYKQLGGQGKIPEFQNLSFHINLGRFSVELDDNLHFNKYRLVTLRSEAYEENRSFDNLKYRNYCKKYEKECLKSGCSGALWTNRAAELHFGRAESPGDLGLNGSPAWKLRAIEDAFKDFWVLKHKVKVLRLSIWDEIMVSGKLYKLNDLLVSPNSNQQELLLKYLERKMINLYA